MKYKVHRLNLDLNKESEVLENFLNNIKGEVVSIITDVRTFFLYYGAKVKTVLIIEKIRK